MPIILPIQQQFDKDIPENFGSLDYRQERALLIEMDAMILASGLEELFIHYFLDLAYVDKTIALLGTGQSPRLTAAERQGIHTDAVMALRMSLLRKHLGLSLRKFSLALSHSDLYRWFCGINRFTLPSIPGKSKIGDLENSLPPHLVDEAERRLFGALQDASAPMLYEPLDFSQAYFDCTCMDVNIHYPIDWLLLRDATRTLMKAVFRIRKVGLMCRMPYDPSMFISKMNGLCMQMTHAKRKKGASKIRKAIFRKMKKLIKRVCGHAMSHLEQLEARWQSTTLSHGQVQQIIQNITGVTQQLAQGIQQAHERIIGERQVASKDKILSLYEGQVHVIVRRKAGAETEFGNTLYLAEQSDGVIIDWHLFSEQAPADSRMLKQSHQRIEERLDVKVKLMAGDRGFDSKDNRHYMENNDIFNAVCPRDPHVLVERLKEETFKQSQKRRSQTEARISILSHGFCGSPMKVKGFDHRLLHMGLSILTHNLWVLARLKMAQEKKREKAQAA